MTGRSARSKVRIEKLEFKHRFSVGRLLRDNDNSKLYDRWMARTIVSAYKRHNFLGFCAFRGESQCVGFLGCDADLLRNKHFFLTKIVVEKTCRCNGVGTDLFHRFLQEIGNNFHMITCYLHEEDSVGWKFLRSLGLAGTGLGRDYFETGDAFVMQMGGKELEDERLLSPVNRLGRYW